MFIIDEMKLELQKRMNLLGLSVKELADKTFLSHQYIQNIFDGKVLLSSVDEFDLSLICSVLHCNSDFITDETVRKRDLLINTRKGDKRAVKVKAKIQDFINDFTFVNEIFSEPA